MGISDKGAVEVCRKMKGGELLLEVVVMVRWVLVVFRVWLFDSGWACCGVLLGCRKRVEGIGIFASGPSDEMG